MNPSPDEDEPQPDGSGERNWRIDRRAFLAGAGALTGAAAIEALTQQAAVYRNAALAGSLLQIHALQPPTFSIDLHRRADLLFLRFDGFNLTRKDQALVRIQPRREANLVVTFLPQHVAEEAYDEGAKADSPGSTRALVAAPSRLAFIVPKSGIPLTIEGLLGWTDLEPALAEAAAYSGPSHTVRHAAHRRKRLTRHHVRAAKTAAKTQHVRARVTASSPPQLFEPGPQQTAIELPYHLALSPTSAGRWRHESKPITLDGSTELWRTQLVTPIGGADFPGGAVRAVWTYDTRDGTPTVESGATGAPPFKSALTPYDRYEIVRASADFTIPGRADISASELSLSARGGSLRSNASWNISELGISAWSHEATQGRDQNVKVVYKGFLFPFGHHVSLVTVTQREFDEQGSETVGVMRQAQYLVASDPLVSYDPGLNPAVINNGRDFPFRSIELMDTSTPRLDKIKNFVSPYVGTRQILSTQFPPFAPTVNGYSFAWRFVGTDWSGRQTSFAAQAVFVSYDDGVDGTKMGFVRDKYNGLDPSDPLRTTDFGGKTLTYAESADAGDTDLPTYGMTFAASPGAGLTVSEHQSADVPGFVPSLAPTINGKPTGAQASVSMPAAEVASGAPLGNNSRPSLAYYAAFVEAGFHSAESAANQGQVFMQILGDATKAPALTFSGVQGAVNKAGAVLAPNIQLQGLSRSLGPVADLDNTFKGKFDATKVFASLTGPQAPRILGGVSLRDIIKEATILDGGGTPDVPNPQFLQIKSTTKGNVATTVVNFQPKLANPPNPPANPSDPPTPTIITERTDGNHPLGFKLTCTITTDLTDPTGSKYVISGELDNFVVNLVTKDGDDHFIGVTFNNFHFTSANGGKPKLGVSIAKVDFAGALKFVEQLSSFLPMSGGGGPNISELLDSISTDLSIKLPSIDVGILSLSHLAIDTGFKLPYDGGPSLFNFGFASPTNPFALAVGIFGGGGFLTLSIGTVGVKEISASFEFGAMAALDIGVASGAVSLTAGFYFKYAVDTTKVDPTKVPPTPPPTTCVLSGFVKLTGNLSVLQIITLSLEFDLTLTYLDPPGSLTGTAQLVVSVSLAFFHKSVTLTATKTFVNGSSSSSARRAMVTGHAAALNTPQTFADQMSQSDWTTYCQAFAPVS